MRYSYEAVADFMRNSRLLNISYSSQRFRWASVLYFIIHRRYYRASVVDHRQ